MTPLGGLCVALLVLAVLTSNVWLGVLAWILFLVWLLDRAGGRRDVW